MRIIRIAASAGALAALAAGGLIAAAPANAATAGTNDLGVSSIMWEAATDAPYLVWHQSASGGTVAGTGTLQAGDVMRQTVALSAGQIGSTSFQLGGLGNPICDTTGQPVTVATGTVSCRLLPSLKGLQWTFTATQDTSVANLDNGPVVVPIDPSIRDEASAEATIVSTFPSAQTSTKPEWQDAAVYLSIAAPTVTGDDGGNPATVTGQGIPNADIQVYDTSGSGTATDPGNFLGGTAADSQGNWSVTLSHNPADGKIRVLQDPDTSGGQYIDDWQFSPYVDYELTPAGPVVDLPGIARMVSGWLGF
ncbi:hypothetical protein IT072_03440 [Leifsonia sp. ZF2019]|uniref:hypothetical protein n=1 Tax=Leifsonia sp. ZF2019 TaxID=2781978 RepID=UPI001CBC6805|nr:hypothetical protein [Leifsonia sp. ZF2019]UAJ80117.1 hypothetical protein IT072_03440 [Leifsonia sp. ZF2019]